MIVETTGIVDGKIDDRYGAKGTQFDDGVPSRSFPLRISGAPAGTAAFAIIFDDPDSVPVCGKVWTHWLAIMNVGRTELPENASMEDTGLIQGRTTGGADHYEGPNPPDRTHTYRLRVLALDFEPVLRKGFKLETLMKLSDMHILAEASLKGEYSPA